MTIPIRPFTTSALALLAPEQRSTVLDHPQWEDIANEPNPARQLAWMVRQDLLSYDELDDLQTFDEDSSEQDRIVEETYALLGQHDSPARYN